MVFRASALCQAIQHLIIGVTEHETMKTETSYLIQKSQPASVKAISKVKATPPSKEPELPLYEINKTAVIIGVVGLTTLIFMAASQRLFLMYFRTNRPPQAGLAARCAQRDSQPPTQLFLKTSRPGRSARAALIEPNFTPVSLIPFPKPLPVTFKAFVTVFTTTPIVMPAEKNRRHHNTVFF